MTTQPIQNPTTERTPHVPPSAMVKVAANLREIERLARRPDAGEPDRLLTQAVNAADDRLMPGGLAMVALAATANLETYGHKLETAEQIATATAYRHGLDPGDLLPEIEDDDSWEPPLQTLCFWTEQWREQLGMEYTTDDLTGPRGTLRVKRPTLASEVSFIRWALDWIWENEIHWNDFAKDMAKVRGRLEDLLTEGFRPSMRGVSCLYDECRGARLIRTTVAKSRKDPETGEKVKVWVLTDWHCPECERTWTEEEYQRHVYAALHREKTFVVTSSTGTEVWCTVELAAKRVDRPESTIRVWLHREQISEVCVLGKPRWRYVLLSDVEARDRLARQRWEQRQAAIKARRIGAHAIGVANDIG